MRRDVPQPPYSVELLADLHADNLPPRTQRALWPLVRRDAESLEVIDALDRVTETLRELGRDTTVATTIPPDVAERLERALGLPPKPLPALATVHRLPVAPTGPGPAAPVQRRRRPIAAAIAAAAVLVAAVSIGVALRPNDPPAPAIQAIDLGDDLQAVQLLALVGRSAPTGRLDDVAVREACLTATGFGARPVLGSMLVTFKGRDGVLMLLGGPAAPRRLTAIVVATDCSATDPELIAQTDIGHA